jgi:hypothetical protein
MKVGYHKSMRANVSGSWIEDNEHVETLADGGGLAKWM